MHRKIPKDKSGIEEACNRLQYLLVDDFHSYRMPMRMIMGMANKISTLPCYLGTTFDSNLQSSDDLCAVIVGTGENWI